MKHYKSLYPNDQIYFMMGVDLLIDIAKGTWEYGKELVESNEFIVTSRNDIDIESAVWDCGHRDKFHLHSFRIFRGSYSSKEGEHTLGVVTKLIAGIRDGVELNIVV
ncbi:hypothetical protein NDS46_30515 (plasmid) [Paenibacillus thiaminolyticus]|uniref:hypothetical protein n=1 Tax=Paenibacillus thiaminolyticus TaxID=49283 RepID=UPI00232CC4CD|nr:hypothetical protein [Paenibacillus thiaminolyticus]WCF11683.1 hypothetical protein NDS46_30515 [Paenibacillus thiaminolyticus]